MTAKKIDTEYKFRLIESARRIIEENTSRGDYSMETYETKVFSLAESIHNWIKKDLDAAK